MSSTEPPTEVTHPKLRSHWDLLSEKEQEAALVLLRCEQSSLFDNWEERGTNDSLKKAMLATAKQLDDDYPGGLVEYRQRAIKLLSDSLKGVNPLDGYVPSVPKGERVVFDSEHFHRLEAIGIGALAYCGVVLLAGGLGERLGFSGLKPALPIEISSGVSFLQWYCGFLLAWQKRGEDSRRIPLAIMTSEDTHFGLRQLMADNAYYGLCESQVYWLTQSKHMAIANNGGDFALKSAYELLTKPGGHGAVHRLMHASGTAQKWRAAGVRHVVFIQDTNAASVRALVSAIGVSLSRELVMNTVTSPRAVGELRGAIARLTHAGSGKQLTANVEYNELRPLLDANGLSERTVDGHSVFPANTNILILKMDTYTDTLERSKGQMREFVNPKYTDSSKRAFKSATRIECLMQDFAFALESDSHSEAVGFTQLPKWLCYTAVKRNLADARMTVAETGTASLCASVAEAELYHCNRRLLAGAPVADSRFAIGEALRKRQIAGIPLKCGARIVLLPSFGCTVADIRSKVRGTVTVSQESTLILDGTNIAIENLTLDGALVVRNTGSSLLTVSELTVRNEGWHLREIAAEEKVAEEFAIRGYVLDRRQTRVIDLQQFLDTRKQLHKGSSEIAQLQTQKREIEEKMRRIDGDSVSETGLELTTEVSKLREKLERISENIEARSKDIEAMRTAVAEFKAVTTVT